MNLVKESPTKKSIKGAEVQIIFVSEPLTLLFKNKDYLLVDVIGFSNLEETWQIIPFSQTYY